MVGSVVASVVILLRGERDDRHSFCLKGNVRESCVLRAGVVLVRLGLPDMAGRDEGSTTDDSTSAYAFVVVIIKTDFDCLLA